MRNWINMIEENAIVVDSSGRILQVNKRWQVFCKEHKLDPDLYEVGRNFFKQFRDRGRTREMETIRKVALGQMHEDSQMYPFALPGGEVQWFSAKVKGLELDHGQGSAALVNLHAVTLDTVERSTAESVLETMGDGFYQLDGQLRFIYMNLNGEKILQIKRRDVIGRKITNAFPGFGGSRFFAEYKLALASKEERFFEEYYEPLGRWFQVSVYPITKGGLAVYFRDITASIVNEKKLKELAYYDSLTGLPNRQKMLEMCQELIAKKKKFTVYFLNLDNIKTINSIHHYKIGDEVLKNISGQLRLLEGEDVQVGRLVGDEFLIVFQPAPSEKLHLFAEKLGQIFKEPVWINDFQSIHLTASVGISCFPYDTTSLDELLSFAENAMAEAKKMPGFSYAFFRPQMRVSQNRRSIIESGLRDLSENSGIHYHLQPQIDGVTNEAKGVEMLARWNHPEIGFISPEEFIAIAEHSGTIAPLTLHLLERLFTQVNEWRRLYAWDITIAINISPALLESPAFFKNFFDLIDLHQFPAKLLEVEVTEQVELAYSEHVLENLQACQNKGICVAIDDFGTGFSMLSYLTNFPIDKIKIDKFFLRQIGEDKKAEALLISIINLAKSIECDVLAEGVERQAEVDFLLRHQCSLFQGYFYDKPMLPNLFEEKYLAAPKSRMLNS